MSDLTERLAAIRERAKSYETANAGMDAYDKAVDMTRDVAPLLAAVEAVLEIHHPSVKWYPGSNQRVELCRSDEEHWPCPTVRAITEHLGATP